MKCLSLFSCSSLNILFQKWKQLTGVFFISFIIHWVGKLSSFSKTQEILIFTSSDAIMEITPELIDKLASLAKLDFSAEEKAALIPELEKITGFMDKLNELDVQGVPPLTYLSDTVFTLTADQREVPRPDVPQPSLSHDLALQNAPKRDSDYFRVPKVLDKSEG